MNNFIVVLKKELTDVFRDKRTLFIAFVIGPVLMPALMAGMMYFMANKEIEKAEKPLELPIIGAEHAPNLVQHLASYNISATAPPEDPESSIRNSDELVILAIDENFAKAWQNNTSAPVELIFDSSRQDTHATLARVQFALQSYAQQVAGARLLLRGVSPGVLQTLRIDTSDLATPEAKGSMALMFIPYFLIIGTFLGGAYVAMDATAGERERQSLEPLLATSAAREAIMSAKLTAAAIYGILSTLLTLIMFMLAFALLANTGIGLSITLSGVTTIKLIAICIPVAVLGATLVTFLSARAKSMKEAQSHMSYLMLIPMLPMVFLMVNPAKDQWWQMLVPILGENQLLMRVLRGEAVNMSEWALCITSTLAIAALLGALAVKMYHKEQLAISA